MNIVATHDESIGARRAATNAASGLTSTRTRELLWTAGIAAAATLVFHLAANPHYGFFRDELYFIICGFHPAWGYVDQPPLVPLISAATQLFGHSLVLLRAVPAIFAALTVGVAVALAAQLGGNRFAQIFTAIVVALTPVLMSFGGQAGTDEANPFLWTLAAYALLRVLDGGDPRWSLVAGAALGIAFETKYSVVFFDAALLGGLLLTPERRLFGNRWSWWACALSLAIEIPNMIWQAVHGFPMLELLRNGQNGKNVIVGPVAYFGQEVLLTNLFLSPIWMIGVVWLALRPHARFLAWTFLLLIGLMLVLHGKHYYPAAIYPIPIAAGCVAIEALTARIRFIRPALAALAFLAGLIFVPFSLPVLPERTFIAYEARVIHLLGVNKNAMSTEHHRTEPLLPQDWADMHGWPEMATAVEGVVARLSPQDRAKALIVASNYGEASAIEFFGHDLPPVASGHNQYWLWGTHGRDGSIVIDVNGDCGRDEHVFRSIELAATFSATYAMPYEQDMPIMICRGLRVPIAQLWPKAKHYI